MKTKTRENRDYPINTYTSWVAEYLFPGPNTIFTLLCMLSSPYSDSWYRCWEPHKYNPKKNLTRESVIEKQQHMSIKFTTDLNFKYTLKYSSESESWHMPNTVSGKKKLSILCISSIYVFWYVSISKKHATRVLWKLVNSMTAARNLIIGIGCLYSV